MTAPTFVEEAMRLAEYACGFAYYEDGDLDALRAHLDAHEARVLGALEAARAIADEMTRRRAAKDALLEQMAAALEEARFLYSLDTGCSIASVDGALAAYREATNHAAIDAARKESK
jgi:multidrug resistance efflux pump